jgi:putative SbcD/Mre11-related phosphoesterase
MLEPVAGARAAVADVGDGRALVVADYHAGLEVALRYDGVEVDSRAGQRRQRLLELLEETGTDRLVVLGDLANAIGAPGGEERREITALLRAAAERVPVTVVRGNHDGALDDAVASVAAEAAHEVALTAGDGVRLGPVGFAHGHTWPAPNVCRAPVVGVGHEHPMVRLVDEVGGSRVEPVWLRGRLDPAPFLAHHDGLDAADVDGDLVVLPGFNELLGGTWINAGQEFLAPFLPEGLADGEAYLLDGTRLGAYDAV